MILINRKFICGFLCISVLLNGIFTVQFFHKKFSYDDKTSVIIDSNVLTFASVSDEMTKPEFWKSHCKDSDKIIMTTNEILELNYHILHTEKCAMNNLVELNETFDSQAVLSEISKNRIPDKDIYVNGEKIDKSDFFGKMQEEISRIDINDNETKYAVAVRRCDIRLWPTDKTVGYSTDDYDDELQNSSVNINEPLVLTLSAEVNNQTYYWAYTTSVAFIPQHYSVSVGYLPMTKANIIDTAFSCLGERYGWGGMNNSMDCSYFIKSVYSCFGLDLPRNTSNQAKIPNKSKSISEMNQHNKLQYIRSLPPCSLLIMPNHVAMYLGTIDGESYFINAQGCNFDRNKGMSTNINTIDIIPLNEAVTKRGTWLEVFTDSVMFED